MLAVQWAVYPEVCHKVCSIGHLPFGKYRSGWQIKLCHKVCSIGHLPWHMIVRLSIQPMWKSLWASSPQVRMGSCASWWLWGLVAPGLGRLKPDTIGSSHRGRLASDFSTFPFISNIIYIPSLGRVTLTTPVKRQFPSN